MADFTPIFVHSFESLATRDGEGIRFGIFLGGCPLHCAYCHNPDTWDMGATREYTPEALYQKIKRYTPYFRASGGGVTFSGGEPLLQAKALLPLVSLLSENNISYTLDTSGALPLNEASRALISGADHIILDLKFPTEEEYKRYTGGSLDAVLDTLACAVSCGKKIWIRTVVVPTINDTTESMDRYLSVLAPYRASIERYELLPFHTMGFFKYEKLGIENSLSHLSALSPEQRDELQSYINRHL